MYGFKEAIFGFADVLAFREDVQLVLDDQVLVQLEMWPPSREESVVSPEPAEIDCTALFYVSSGFVVSCRGIGCSALTLASCSSYGACLPTERDFAGGEAQVAPLVLRRIVRTSSIGRGYPCQRSDL